jgi:hypothetical protein
VLPIALAFAFKAFQDKWLIALRGITVLLTAYLFIYNLWLTISFLVS